MCFLFNSSTKSHESSSFFMNISSFSESRRYYVTLHSSFYLELNDSFLNELVETSSSHIYYEMVIQ
jgi:hypothetical protein